MIDCNGNFDIIKRNIQKSIIKKVCDELGIFLEKKFDRLYFYKWSIILIGGDDGIFGIKYINYKEENGKKEIDSSSKNKEKKGN